MLQQGNSSFFAVKKQGHVYFVIPLQWKPALLQDKEQPDRIQEEHGG